MEINEPSSYDAQSTTSSSFVVYFATYFVPFPRTYYAWVLVYTLQNQLQ